MFWMRNKENSPQKGTFVKDPSKSVLIAIIQHTVNSVLIAIIQHTVNSVIFARVLFSRNFANAKFRENKIPRNGEKHSVVY